MLTIGNQSESDADAPEGVSAFLALGGNLGDREAVFRDALRRLRENGFAVEAVSSFYETAPVGCEPGAPAFYNAVVRGRWAGSPEAVFPTLHRSASAILHSLDSRGEMPRRVKDASGKGC